MTNQESKEIANQLVKLINVVNSIEKDAEAHDKILSHCREIADIIKSK